LHVGFVLFGHVHASGLFDRHEDLLCAHVRNLCAWVSDLVWEKEGVGTLVIQPRMMRKLRRYFEIFRSAICRAIQLVHVM
jgi:hypothetical protein